MHIQKVPQDLHIHTTFSANDSSVMPEMTVDMIAFAQHAEIVGISDHFEGFMPEQFEEYQSAVRSHGFKLGTEVNGHPDVPMAVDYDFDYYIYHCWGHKKKDYIALNDLINTGKPTIIAHPNAVATDLNIIPESCYVEINNRYIWRFDWRTELIPFLEKFKWVINSDAHQPNWLNQNIARRVADELGIKESILFPKD